MLVIYKLIQQIIHQSFSFSDDKFTKHFINTNEVWATKLQIRRRYQLGYLNLNIPGGIQNDN